MNEKLKQAIANFPAEFHLKVARISAAAGITENDPAYMFSCMQALLGDQLREDQAKFLSEHSDQHQKFSEQLALHHKALRDSSVTTTKQIESSQTEGRLLRAAVVAELDKIIELQDAAERRNKQDDEQRRNYSDFLASITVKLMMFYLAIGLIVGILLGVLLNKVLPFL